ncbi:MAG: S8 family serine peptidase [Ectothiorhodospiraceae bacterium]|nr:S8 family serine peptidase [Ectothiorhodospiraceae bacterium]
MHGIRLMPTARLFAACLLLLSLAPALAATPDGGDHTGEIIVHYHHQPGAGLQGLAPEQALAARGGPGRMVRALHGGNAKLVRPDRQEDFASLLAHYRADPTVAYAEPNYRLRLLDAPLPDDPILTGGDSAGLWWLCARIENDTCTSTPETDADTRAPFAWRLIGAGSQTVTVAVVDSGIAGDHPDLAGNIGPLARFIATCPAGNTACQEAVDNDDVTDIQGHGSHVAGIIGAVGNNGEGITGINWQVGLLPVKLWFPEESDADDSCGDPGQPACPSPAGAAELAEAINWITDETDARVINLSLALSGNSRAVSEAIQRAGRERGVLVVAAAGNNRNGVINNDLQPVYPASYPLDNIISVAAIGPDGALATYSHFGPDSVHLAAPGGAGNNGGPRILSTWLDGGYEEQRGTSMSTPMVAGAAALYWSRYPEADYRTLRELIVQSSWPDDRLASRVVGPGRLDLEAMARVAPGELPQAVAPMRPTHLTARENNGGIVLRWVDNSTINDGYTVQWRPAGESTWQILDDTLPPDANSYRDDRADFGDHRYRVLATSALHDPGCCASAIAMASLESPGGGSGGGGGCFIATAAYGTPMADDIQVLREFREQVLRPHAAGRWLIQRYEQLSPPVADAIARRPWLQASVRLLLRPVVALARWLL